MDECVVPLTFLEVYLYDIIAMSDIRYDDDVDYDYDDLDDDDDDDRIMMYD
jgi:hypothetical protein